MLIGTYIGGGQKRLNAAADEGTDNGAEGTASSSDLGAQLDIVIDYASGRGRKAYS